MRDALAGLDLGVPRLDRFDHADAEALFEGLFFDGDRSHGVVLGLTNAFSEQLRGTVTLPASKSISARALIIAALAGNAQLENLSDCDDTTVLRRALAERRFRERRDRAA